ncbi:MAG: AEC family transporter [Clostridia bacterium]|nr:AEC family transporter [Clostridia bacterium]
MELFEPIFNQMLFLFAFIVLGFVFAKWKFVPDESSRVLSKLENLLFIPALVMGTFIKYCNVETLASVWRLLLMSAVMLAVLIPLSVLAAKLCFKEKFLQNIATYGLAFSNFGYMGNAIVSVVFPELFFEYLIFTLPLWFMIYLWGAPVLLILGSSDGEQKQTLGDRLKAFLNPMFICMFIGLLLGLTGWNAFLPVSIVNVIDVAGNCMSPVAMLLTGMVIGKCDVLALLKKWRIYVISAIKLFAYPLLYVLVFAFIPQSAFVSKTFLICGMCFACMPMGLNAIVVPAAYGKDTSDAAGMALVSHLLSVLSIPLLFMLFNAVVL